MPLNYRLLNRGCATDSIVINERNIVMCTAISFVSSDHYFGRTLDLEYRYQEAVTVTPRNYPFVFRTGHRFDHHYAIIGVATVSDGYPLYYDAANEAGLGMAGLNFPGNAAYRAERAGMDNIAPFELIPWVLSQCQTVQEAKALLQKTNLAAIPFSEEYSLSDLHWIISDFCESITVEPLRDGLIITQNPVGVLTNNPPFDYHLHHLCNYMSLTENTPNNTIAPTVDLTPYSRGMGAMGMPGDLSSASRFVRAVYTKYHSVTPTEELTAVSQFFHILGSVAQQEGCVRVGDGYEKTVYTSCCNTTKGIYYYTTYENSQISAVHLYHENLDSGDLVSYPLLHSPQIRMDN